MDSNVVILLTLPLLITACDQEKEDIRRPSSPEEKAFWQASLQDISPSAPGVHSRIDDAKLEIDERKEAQAPGVQSRIGYVFSEAEKGREYYAPGVQPRTGDVLLESGENGEVNAPGMQSKRFGDVLSQKAEKGENCDPGEQPKIRNVPSELNEEIKMYAPGVQSRIRHALPKAEEDKDIYAPGVQSRIRYVSSKIVEDGEIYAPGVKSRVRIASPKITITDRVICAPGMQPRTTDLSSKVEEDNGIHVSARVIEREKLSQAKEERENFVSGAQSRHGKTSSESEGEREIYASLTQEERNLFRSATDPKNDLDPYIPDEKFEEGISSKRLPNRLIGVDNILDYFPEYEAVINDVIKPMMPPGTHDSLQLVNGCCPQFQFFKHETTLLNIYNENKTLVHFNHLQPPLHQYTHLGLCANEGGLFGQTGHCLQGYVNSMLLTFSAQKKITFDLFRIPAFCKCYNF